MSKPDYPERTLLAGDDIYMEILPKTGELALTRRDASGFLMDAIVLDLEAQQRLQHFMQAAESATLCKSDDLVLTHTMDEVIRLDRHAQLRLKQFMSKTSCHIFRSRRVN